MALSAEILKEQSQRDWSIYRCVTCGHNTLGESTGAMTPDMVRCTSCSQIYKLRHGVLDSLVRPDPEAIRELQGMARELGLSIDEWEKVKIHEVSSSASMEDLIASTKDLPTSYYEQITDSFNQAFNIVKAAGPFKRVLEVGSDAPFAFLKPFAELGAQCFTANLRYFWAKGADHSWPEKTLADMNELPYADGVFDVVLLSATSHHSPNLEKTVSEVRRVLKPKGVALFINDQISGLFKIIKDEGHRDGLIHENFYSIAKYHRAFTRHGFRPEYLFSDYYDKKLERMQIHPQVRFAQVARLVSKPWRIRAFRNFARKRLLWTAHILFGFPLNAILWKEE